MEICKQVRNTFSSVVNGVVKVKWMFGNLITVTALQNISPLAKIKMENENSSKRRLC